MSKAGARDILGDLMASEVDGGESETTLGVSGAEKAASADKADRCSGYGLILSLVDDLADTGVVGNEEGGDHRVGLETLLAVPGHVVQCGEGTVREEEVV